MYQQRGEFQRALSDVDRALAIEETAEAHTLRAELRETRGDSEGALADDSRAIELGLEDCLPRLSKTSTTLSSCSRISGWRGRIGGPG